MLNADRESVLHRALHQRNIDLVKTLLKRGAEGNFPNGGGLTPLILAVTNDDMEMLMTLLPHADINLGCLDAAFKESFC